MDKSKVIAILELVWKQHPDLRLCQLISIVLDGHLDLFYVSDETFVHDLLAWVKEMKADNESKT